ncbi:P-loop containing nucleoside triphosphate hydrolase protein [Jimgerdemannia flammicorona]|uniref:P-loop containing nucleoside triphosphate hydrolase protein n=1 Tax=Jimgerdemannia flammicorona TaxID=994334 RepID=A0A433B9S4_9FUNG|nr:P-loop containing nucleoside triphosphate hydrolase protein [Jimgerdemannia flammicorona]
MIRSHLNAIYAVAFLISLVDLRSLYLVHGILSVDLTYAVALANSVVTLALCVVVASECKEDQPVKRTENRRYLSKEVNASIYSRFMFNWVKPMMKEGYSRAINDEDLPELPVENRTKYALANFREHRVTSLLLSLGYSFRSELTIQVFYALGWSIFIFGPPYFLNLIVGFIEKAPSQREPIFTAYLYVFGLFISNVVQSLSFQRALYIGRVLHIRIRSIIIGEVYAKALRRRDTTPSNASKDDAKAVDSTPTTEDKTEKKIGNINNLVSVDTQKIGELSAYIFYIYAYPIQILICIWSLWRLLGYSAMFGVAVIIITYPLPAHLSKAYENSHKDVMQATDKRLTLMNELLHAMRIVKFFAWESQFRSRILKARENELKAIRSRLMQYLWMGNVWFIIPILIMLSVFLAYTKLAGNELTATVAFTALALFTNLRFALDEMPFIVSSILQTKVALRRVADFLAEPEIDKDAHEVRIGKAEFIGFKDNASFQWFYNVPDGTGAEPDSANPGQKFKLKNLNISFPPGELSIVCGPTGCGKTSLISSLMGETNCLAGRAVLPRKRSAHRRDEGGAVSGTAYVSQTAWLQNDTIRNNVLFGRPFDEDRYQQVLYMCALTRDLEILEHGDQTEIGEKGITLSGGQKQRLALARAVYSQADIIILDDCLSAVDAHTAKHLYEHCLMGCLMRGRTRILVTHHVGLCLRGAAHVVAMRDGEVVGSGSPADVLRSGVLGDEVTLEEERIEEKESEAVEGKVPVLPVTVTKKHEEGSGKLVADETRAKGGVSREVYALYFNAAGGVWFWIAVVALFALTQVMVIGQDYWIKVWAAAYKTENADLKANATRFDTASVLFGSQSYSQIPSLEYVSKQVVSLLWIGDGENVEVDVNYYLIVYFLIEFHYDRESKRWLISPLTATSPKHVGVATMLVATVRSWLLFMGSLEASRSLHANLLDRILRAKLRFFDTTPLGRIVNRFSSDMETVDQNVAPSASYLLYSVIATSYVIMLVSYVTPLFLIPGFFIALIFWGIGLYYLRTSRNLKRLNSTSRSPIYVHFSETVNGVSTIRAFGAEQRFIRDNWCKVDTNNRPFIWMWATNRWLHCRVDILGAFFGFCTGVVIVMSISWIDAGMAGLSLSYALTFTHHILWVVRMYAANEMNLNAIERVQEYMQIDEEPPSRIPENAPAASWPHAGEIVVEDLVMQYAPENPSVIKDLSFHVRPREKVGIVGRTGSGKSTLAISLFRFMEPTKGRIVIDGVDIHKIGLEDLRSKLTIIPQDPVLFSGTLRSNLDPFDQHDDAALWAALKRSHLIEEGGSASEQFASLDSPVSENGSNFSQGQRQLIALARALVKRSKLIVMDEATSSVDFDTDHKIQQTIRNEFVDSSLLCIAHRIRTVADYDRILVLDAGQVVEYDTPYKLMMQENGVFRSMCERSGEFVDLLAIAKTKAEQDHAVGGQA